MPLGGRSRSGGCLLAVRQGQQSGKLSHATCRGRRPSPAPKVRVPVQARLRRLCPTGGDGPTARLLLVSLEPSVFSSTFILQGAAYPTAVVARLPDSGGMTWPHLAAVCAKPGPLGSPRGQSPWGCCPTQIISRLPDCAYCPTARLGFAVQTPDCMYPTATRLYSSGQYIHLLSAFLLFLYYIYIYI